MSIYTVILYETLKESTYMKWALKGTKTLTNDLGTHLQAYIYFKNHETNYY